MGRCGDVLGRDVFGGYQFLFDSSGRWVSPCSFNNKWADRIFSHLDERPILSVTLRRLLFQTLPVLNYALALANIRFRHYLVGTFLGLPIPIFLYCYFFEIIFKHVLKV